MVVNLIAQCSVGALCPKSVRKKIKNVRGVLFSYFRMQFFEVFPKQLISNYLKKTFLLTDYSGHEQLGMFKNQLKYFQL